MPQLIEEIDRIARQKQRDVLFIECYNPNTIKEKIRNYRQQCQDDNIEPDENLIMSWSLSFLDWENNTQRQALVQWLDEEGIPWRRCAPFSDGELLSGYIGTIYVDIPFDKTLPAYQKLEAYLENPDGSMKFSDLSFYVLSLEYAMQYAYRDDPGYYDDW